MEFSRWEYWSGLPCLSSGYLPNSGIVPRSPALQADSLPFELPGKPNSYISQWIWYPIKYFIRSLKQKNRERCITCTPPPQILPISGKYFTEYFVVLKTQKPADLINFTEESVVESAWKPDILPPGLEYILSQLAAQKWEERNLHYFDIRVFFSPLNKLKLPSSHKTVNYEDGWFLRSQTLGAPRTCQRPWFPASCSQPLDPEKL